MPLRNSNTLPPADMMGRLNAKISCATPVTTRYTPNSTAATRMDRPGQTKTSTPKIRANTPETSVVFHKFGSRLGTDVSIAEVWHNYGVLAGVSHPRSAQDAGAVSRA
ncbi:hypothetical protein MHIB_15830 [Mycolicibacter hiberniae]|uniref:Uncharacterized protein n=1 Tax=Mycolicibacter hiberniae TaxID=29314 RepID=A0A7I7X1W6_9MYCO|nr:hypothetical protein MHIB_15830 [Mycolicibacter hiberniae]